MRKSDVLSLADMTQSRASHAPTGYVHDLWERGLPAMTVVRLDSIPALYVRLILQRQTVEITLKVGQETVSNLMATVGGNRRGMG